MSVSFILVISVTVLLFCLVVSKVFKQSGQGIGDSLWMFFLVILLSVLIFIVGIGAGIGIMIMQSPKHHTRVQHSRMQYTTLTRRG